MTLETLARARLWNAPLTIVLFALLHAPTFVLPAVHADLKPGLLVGLALVAAAIVLLWRGSRIAWVFFAIASAVAVLTQPIDRLSWWVFAVDVISVVLLMTPVTQRYVWGRVRFLPRALTG